VSPPLRLRELNYVFFYEEPKLPDSGFGTGLAELVTALNTDFDWLREHTRYLQRAMEWDTGGRPANRLLSGNDIREAKAWAAHRPKSAPEPTALQLDFIRASEEEAEVRTSEQRKQLEAIAAAQTAREVALHEREQAFRQAAEAQRRRARIRNIAIAVSILAGCLAFGSLGVFTRMGHAVRMTIQAESGEALAFGKDLAAIVEAAETKRDGRPGEFTAKVLEAVADYAFVQKKFSEALDAANRAHTFLPNSLSIETMQAHALMFLGRRDEANALYLAHKGEPIPELNNKLWEQTIADDFEVFRKEGVTNPMMADVEKELGISH
jgi:tetratricopeptide (TPR) repeat protein